MQLVCANCSVEFIASKRQERRTRWAKKNQPLFGFCCSALCISAMGVKHRRGNRLDAQRLSHSRLNNAVDAGKLVRPETCSMCGVSPGKDRLGRSRIEGHHPDHAEALKVEWICDTCHKEITPKARGERNGSSRLTELEVRQIRRMASQGRAGIAIAPLFGVTKKTVYDILHGRTWGFLA